MEVPPHTHGSLYGYANDGFGIYTYTDVGGDAPVLDECDGQFGPVPYLCLQLDSTLSSGVTLTPGMWHTTTMPPP